MLRAKIKDKLYSLKKNLKKNTCEKKKNTCVFFVSTYIFPFFLLQYLFENGRIDNIFTEPYSRFMIELTKLLKIWEPTILPNGRMLIFYFYSFMICLPKLINFYDF